MRRLLLITGVLAALASSSCKKAIEEKQKQLILQAMTEGRWYVELYKDTTADVTGDFFGYEFQFYEDNKVDGIYNSVTRSTGAWSADISSYSIIANFPASAGDTLRRLNYTWKLTDSYTNYVEAKTTTANGENILHLRKK